MYSYRVLSASSVDIIVFSSVFFVVEASICVRLCVVSVAIPDLTICWCIHMCMCVVWMNKMLVWNKLSFYFTHAHTSIHVYAIHCHKHIMLGQTSQYMGENGTIVHLTGYPVDMIHKDDISMQFSLDRDVWTCARPSSRLRLWRGVRKNTDMYTSCYAICDQTGSTNMTETGKINSRSLTSYSTSIQCMDLSGTVSRIETTSGFGKTESAEIRRRLVSKRF